MPKLLLVEDDNNLREIYEARLQAEGYTIVTARDGEEALVVAKAEKPDLVIADVMMPKISGFEMLDILRSTDGLKGVKVIMLTALGQSEDQQRAARLGADRYLVKSQVTLEDIVKVTHELLGDTVAAPLPPTPGITSNPEDLPKPEEPAPATPAPSVETPVEPVSEPVAEEPVKEEPAAAEPVASEPPKPLATQDGLTDDASATAQAASEEATKDAEPASKEESEVEASIEDFVAGATQDATPPTDTADPAASTATDADANTATEPAEEPHEAPAASAESAVDDKLMADAVKDLSSNEVLSEEGDSAEAAVEDPVNPSKEAEEDEAKKNHPVGSQRVITPIPAEPKKDINQLLADEEAKEAAANSAVSPDQPNDETKADPSNIAL